MRPRAPRWLGWGLTLLSPSFLLVTSCFPQWVQKEHSEGSSTNSICHNCTRSGGGKQGRAAATAYACRSRRRAAAAASGGQGQPAPAAPPGAWPSSSALPQRCSVAQREEGGRNSGKGARARQELSLESSSRAPPLASVLCPNSQPACSYLTGSAFHTPAGSLDSSTAASSRVPPAPLASTGAVAGWMGEGAE